MVSQYFYMVHLMFVSRATYRSRVAKHLSSETAENRQNCKVSLLDLYKLLPSGNLVCIILLEIRLQPREFG